MQARGSALLVGDRPRITKVPSPPLEMALLVWNLRGLNAPKKKREVVHLARDKEVDILGLLEMKIKNHKHFPTRFF